MHECRYDDVTDALSFAVAVIVAAIPLALEIVVTSTLALGSRKLAQEGAIVTRLAAIEDLSGMNILCSDKTGAQCCLACAMQRPNSIAGLWHLQQHAILTV